MPGLTKVVPYSAIAAFALLINSVHISGQSAPFPEHGRSFAINAAADALPAELTRIDDMLHLGELDIASEQEDTMFPGRRHERLKQVYRGLPVFGGQLARQMDGRGIVSVLGRLCDAIDLDVTPGMSAERAAGIARGSSGPGASIHGEIVLGVLPIDNGRYRLVYEVDLRDGLESRVIDIDAGSGEVVQSLSRVRTASVIGQGTGVLGDRKKISTDSTTSSFQAMDRARPARVLTLDFRGSFSRLNNFLNTGFTNPSDIATDSDNVWSDPVVVDAHVYQGWTYDFYFKTFGRRGIDDRNSEVVGIVHPLARADAFRYSSDTVNTFIDNALWLEGYEVMMYGDGTGRIFNYLAGGLDVIAHELTHGVTEHSSALIYQDESGALNEAFSDIMGVSAEFSYQPVGSGPQKSDWLIGEDVTIASPGYLRSLNNPNALGDPDHYSLRRFIGTEVDNGGVHFNLTIATHAFYLAVAGGQNRVSRITVTGVGMNNLDRMEKIFYRGFVFLLGPNARFTDARAATLQAASDLYGSSSNERAQLAAAWTAVGVN